MTEDLQENGEGVTILPPDYSLKKALGENVDPRELFSEEVVKQAQQNIAVQQQNFLQWFAEDIDLLERYSSELCAASDTAAVNVEHLHLIAISIKSQGGTFGFNLASDVARSLYMFLPDFSYCKDHCTVIRKHIDTLRVIYERRITGTGGQTGRELLHDLSKLTQKFTSPN